MFKELLSIWHDDSALSEILKRFDEMLFISKEMFILATNQLVDKENTKNVHDHIIKMDSKLNTLQQVIRRDVVTHISIQGTSDVVPCLQLMSLIKDAERIGDYCKNIHDIVTHYPVIHTDPLLEQFLTMRHKLLAWFDETKRAFDNIEKNLADQTRQEAYALEKECDRIISSIAMDNNGRNAVPAALMLRFFKRVAAHLSNICTSVIMPLDKMDYFDSSK